MIRYLREHLSAPACGQCKEAWPQVPCRIYCSTTVTRHWYGDPQDYRSHYRRNQIWGSGSIPLLTQTQDAQHEHAGAHHLLKCINAAIMSSIKQQLLKCWLKFTWILPLTWSRKLLPKVRYAEGYVANMDAVSFGPYTVNTPPLKSIIASETETEET